MLSTRSIWVSCGLVAGLGLAVLLGRALAEDARGSGSRATDEVGRYQISSWAIGSGKSDFQRGAYLVDTKTGEVFEVVGRNRPRSLGRSETTAKAKLEKDILVCSEIHAKAMPTGFEVEAMKFTGPAGDGRRGSAGFVVPSRKLLGEGGTQLWFTFQRAASGYGFQVIHPRGDGHVLVSVLSGVTIHRGGSWGNIGWGNPGSSDKVNLTKSASKVLPLKVNVEHTVTSELSAEGRYRLWIDDHLVCEQTVDKAEPLVLEVPEKARIWGGSGWNRTQFAGEGFRAKLEPGHAGLILGPMDGSGPTQNFRNIHLRSVGR